MIGLLIVVLILSWIFQIPFWAVFLISIIILAVFANGNNSY